MSFDVFVGGIEHCHEQATTNDYYTSDETEQKQTCKNVVDPTSVYPSHVIQE